MNITPLSQRDPAWKNAKLGTSNQTIGDFGCVLTSLTMLVNYATGKKFTVQLINQMIIDGGGYVDGNLMNWIKVGEIFPYLKFMWRGWSYDNAAVADYVNKRGIPVIVQVDAAPIGAPRTDHYVLFIGGGQLADPWDGKIKATTTYPTLKGYILYDILKDKLPVPVTQTYDELLKKIDSLQTTEKDLRLQLGNVATEKDQWKSLAGKKDQEIKDKNNNTIDRIIVEANKLRM